MCAQSKNGEKIAPISHKLSAIERITLLISMHLWPLQTLQAFDQSKNVQKEARSVI